MLNVELEYNHPVHRGKIGARHFRSSTTHHTATIPPKDSGNITTHKTEFFHSSFFSWSEEWEVFTSFLTGRRKEHSSIRCVVHMAYGVASSPKQNNWWRRITSEGHSGWNIGSIVRSQKFLTWIPKTNNCYSRQQLKRYFQLEVILIFVGTKALFKNDQCQ